MRVFHGSGLKVKHIISTTFNWWEFSYMVWHCLTGREDGKCILGHQSGRKGKVL